MRPLTPRQREVLLQIQLHLEQTGFPPTRAEIAEALGFRSVNAAEDHLKALVRKGMIETCAGMSRGIRLLPPAEVELGLAGRTEAGRGAAGRTGSRAGSHAIPLRSQLPEGGQWRTAATMGAAGGNWGLPGSPGAVAPRGRPAAAPRDTAGTRDAGGVRGALSRDAAASRDAATHRDSAAAEALRRLVAHSMALPLVGRVAAGHPILAEANIEATFTLDASLFERQPDYLLRVRGDSMRDAGMLDGDLLAVKSTTDAHNGQIVVARLGNEVTVKRLRRQTPQGAVELLPENPAYQPIVVQDEADFRIEGIGVGLIRQRPSRL